MKEGCSTTECLRPSIFVNVIGRVYIYMHTYILPPLSSRSSRRSFCLVRITNCQLETLLFKAVSRSGHIYSISFLLGDRRASSSSLKACELNFNARSIRIPRQSCNNVRWNFGIFFFWIDFLAALTSGYCPSYGTFIGRDKWCRIIMVCRVEQASYGQTSNVGQL